MAAPWAVHSIAVAVVLGVSVQAGAVDLPESNSRHLFRSSEALFYGPWPQAPAFKTTLNSTIDYAVLDTAVYSSPGELPTWIDILYPWQWEKAFGAGEGLDCEVVALVAMVRQVWWVGYVAVGAYLAALYLGIAAMKGRDPLHLKRSLALWNLLLAVFSLAGAVRTVPHLALLLQEFGFEYTVCRLPMRSYGIGASGFWVTLFVFSKFAELLDTAFLVIRKKPVAFLHWYHHATVLLYCWHSYMWEMPTGIWFAAVNYTVHAVMYFYYYLAAVSTRPPRWACGVTVLQLSQMVVGMVVTTLHLRILVYSTVSNCDGHVPNLLAALGMYASYFYLFAAFFVSRFCCRRQTREAGKKVE